MRACDHTYRLSIAGAGDGSPTSSATLSLMPEASSQGQRRLSMHATTG